MLMLIDISVIWTVFVIMSITFPIVGVPFGGMSSAIVKFVILTVCLILSRYFLRVYSSIWRYANVRSYGKIIVADFIGYFVHLMLGIALYKIVDIKLGFIATTLCVMAIMLMTLLSRFCYQLLYEKRNQLKEIACLRGEKNNKINIAIVGAGNIGASLAEELLRNSSAHYNPYCFIDNDRAKIGNTIRGIKILADNEKIIETLKGMPVQEIIIALPDADSETKSRLYEFYRRTGCKVKLYDFAGGYSDSDSNRRVIREFEIEELLFRDAISLKSDGLAKYYRNKVVLVTGGGGSIGSELCRQIASCSPKHLIIVDIYENNAYTIQQELVRKYGDKLNLTVQIASVRDQARMDKIFEAYRPEVVFHAAAHKHVPLMENSPMEAIKNNVFGTYNTANAAEKYGVKKFILISTDKAVNPTNVMGASKRVCEMLIQCRQNSKTEFAAVRFGNVLGSNGSVVPLFKQQILAGGPVTITDKRIIRYFMTIPEAVALVMETGLLASGGELFALDMGKPVKILSLAEKMISLMGFVPYKDIDIVEVGLRKGEKLYEELLIKSEELDKTANDLIFVERDKPYSREEIEEKLGALREAMLENDKMAAINVLKEAVPTYVDSDELNKNAAATEEMRLCEETVGAGSCV